MICESGTQDELLAKKGVYKKLWETQQSLEKYTKSDTKVGKEKLA